MNNACSIQNSRAAGSRQRIRTEKLVLAVNAHIYDIYLYCFSGYFTALPFFWMKFLYRFIFRVLHHGPSLSLVR